MIEYSKFYQKQSSPLHFHATKSIIQNGFQSTKYFTCKIIGISIEHQSTSSEKYCEFNHIVARSNICVEKTVKQFEQSNFMKLKHDMDMNTSGNWNWHTKSISNTLNSEYRIVLYSSNAQHIAIVAIKMLTTIHFDVACASCVDSIEKWFNRK